MEGVLREDRRKSLRVLNWAIRLTQTIRSQPRGSCLASSPLLGTNGRLARWGNSRPPISPPRARPVIQGAVENGCALAFSAGALVNFPAPLGTITLCSQLSGHSSRLQQGEWRRRAPDQGSSVCRPPQPCGRHLIGGDSPVRVEVHASEKTVEIFVEADFETHAEERRRFAIMNIPRHPIQRSYGQAARRGAKKDRLNDVWTPAPPE
jgi:hypothetical protein